jgi:hypothetical protein
MLPLVGITFLGENIGDLLIKHKKDEIVGACFRNYSLHEYEEDPGGYLEFITNTGKTGEVKFINLIGRNTTCVYTYYCSDL